VLDRTRELTEANIELDAFSYTIAHDLRAPLRNIRGMGDALREDYAGRLPPQAAEYVERMQRGAQRMDALISDLLAYSRIGRDGARLGPVDIEACVAEVLRDLEAEIAARGARIVALQPLGRVLAHRTMLHQVLANLIGNGLKFVAPGVTPDIAVRGEDRGECWRTWVTDNGIGLDMRYAERIFRPFERLHGQEAYPGTGIGLAIVKKSVEWMGGRAGVESSGAGTRFWFELRKAR
jgi:light-regulated signal transduction histidine kinase (bacteriophytochrome)